MNAEPRRACPVPKVGRFNLNSPDAIGGRKSRMYSNPEGVQYLFAYKHFEKNCNNAICSSPDHRYGASCVNVAEVWLSPFFHWKKGCELSAAADARDDDSSNTADKKIKK